MELQEFIYILYAAGWKAPNDAQHERIKKVYAEIVALTQRVKQLETANAKYKGALEKLARLGNEPYLGNSVGNMIAQDALLESLALPTDLKDRVVIDDRMEATNEPRTA